jgi:UDPglucose--hexose-1-phosphate uridylyltransferase
VHDQPMDFIRQLLTAEMLDPGTGRLVRTGVDVRVDPLTGHSSRILPERGLMPVNDFDLESFARESEPRCPFCPERIDALTPALPPEIDPDGRIVRGEAVLFPNLHAYSSHSCVSVYSPRLHYLPLEDMTERLVADNLLTQVTYAKAVLAADPESRWASINANHMLPSGSSLFHPHLQGIVDSQPTTIQRMLAGVPAERFDAYLETERRAGERYLVDTGQVEWLVSFAPIAPAELRAFIGRISSPVDADEDLVVELAHGLALALNAYAELGFESFNLAVYGAPPEVSGYPLNLRLAVRSNLSPFYRSDSTLLERLHWEGAIDLPPETIAERIAGRFRA